MFKKAIAVLIVAFMAVFCAIPAMAQIDFNDEEAVMQALAKEPPLTQADIDNYIKYFPRIEKAANADDDAALFALAKEIGWSEIRMVYVPLKVGISVALIEEPESAEMMQVLFPPEFMPNDTEKKLVEQNIPKLSALFEN